MKKTSQPHFARNAELGKKAKRQKGKKARRPEGQKARRPEGLYLEDPLERPA